jgi:hypothetical protein
MERFKNHGQVSARKGHGRIRRTAETDLEAVKRLVVAPAVFQVADMRELLHDCAHPPSANSYRTATCSRAGWGTEMKVPAGGKKEWQPTKTGIRSFGTTWRSSTTSG